MIKPEILWQRKRRRDRKWYRRHRAAKKAVVGEYRTDEYKRQWYAENREWNKAKTRLRRIIRPDVIATECLQMRYPLMKVKLVECENAKELAAYYKVKLRELRILFGRNPDTGRLKRRKNADDLHH